MFAALPATAEAPLDLLVEVAQSFTPRFQVVGPFVLLDVSGLSALFGSASELGASLAAAQPCCRSVTLASTASAALLLAVGSEGLRVVAPGEERAALAPLSVDVLIPVIEAREEEGAGRRENTVGSREPGVGSREPGPPAEASAKAGVGSRENAGGWRHPRATHQAQHTRRATARSTARPARGAVRKPASRPVGLSARSLALTLHRWGVHTLGALAALPRDEVHERLGVQGVSWQRLAGGEDDEPLVPWVAGPVFEETLELEWPIEGFEPLSFVLARLFESLAVALERADRGAVAIRTALHLATREVHLRVLPLPAPMRDPKTLRTLVLLDLESHPPAAAIDRVQVRLEPTPGRVLQWTLFDRARPAPEQVTTLLARLTALVGEGHVGAPALVDSWRPGAFEVVPFGSGVGRGETSFDTLRTTLSNVEGAGVGPARRSSLDQAGERRRVPRAFRRFRLPVPVRVRVEDGRPVRLMTDRPGLAGGAIAQAAGPWRTSGAWWEGDLYRESGVGSRESGVGSRESGVGSRESGAGSRESGVGNRVSGVPGSRFPAPGSRRDRSPWDRDEWDIALAEGTVYRLFVERDVGQWFLEGVVD